MSDIIYCYPNSDVLINKLGIREIDTLYEAEMKFTSFRLVDLSEKPIKGRYDLKHLQQIHKYIFQDIYEWAGNIRTVDIAKSNMFCNVMFIQSQADEIFNKLTRDNYLKNLDQATFCSKLAYYFGEINALHPFREGNGRTQREFIKTLSLDAGYKINFNNITKDEMVEASIDSFMCNYSKMEKLLRKCINPILEKSETLNNVINKKYVNRNSTDTISREGNER
jgi:cell filamentation protein